VLALIQPSKNGVTNLAAWSHVPRKQHQHGEEQRFMLCSTVDLAEQLQH